MYEGVDLSGLTNIQSSAMTWDTIKRMRDATRMKMVLKGLLAHEDATLAVGAGVDAIIVSNHGARSEDSGRSTIDALPEILEAVKGRMPVLVDSGFRRGTDIVKALCMGAAGVCVGRPYIWGLGAFGQPGVERALELLRIETAAAMQQVGAPSIKHLRAGDGAPGLRQGSARASVSDPGEQDEVEGRITRRDLIKNAGLAGAAVATGGLSANAGRGSGAAGADALGPRGRCRDHRRGRNRHAGGDRGEEGGLLRDRRRCEQRHRRSCDLLGRQHSARRRHVVPEEGRHQRLPDLVFKDLTDWSVVQPNGAPDYRYNDKEIIRAFADNCAQTFEFLVENGVKFVKDVPDGRAGSAHGNSVPRQMHVAVLDWPQVQTGRPVDPLNARPRRTATD